MDQSLSFPNGGLTKIILVVHLMMGEAFGSKDSFSPKAKEIRIVIPQMFHSEG